MTMSRRSIAIGLAGLGMAGIAAPCFAQPTTTSSAAASSSSLYAIVFRAGPKWRPGIPMAQQGLREHFLYVRDLHARGIVLLGGPRGTEGGLMILRASSQAEAERILAADPAVTAGLFVGEATSFTPRFVSDKPFAAAAP
jgi:uncharacterized protein YciI